MAIDDLIAKIEIVLEELDKIPAENRAESSLIKELEVLLEQYKELKQDPK